MVQVRLKFCRFRIELQDPKNTSLRPSGLCGLLVPERESGALRAPI